MCNHYIAWINTEWKGYICIYIFVFKKYFVFNLHNKTELQLFLSVISFIDYFPPHRFSSLKQDTTRTVVLRSALKTVTHICGSTDSYCSLRCIYYSNNCNVNPLETINEENDILWKTTDNWKVFIHMDLIRIWFDK